MIFWIVQKRPNIEIKKEDGNVTEEYGQRMPLKKVDPFVALAKPLEGLFFQERIVADPMIGQLTIMLMVMIMCLFPNRGRSKDKHSKYCH